MRGLRRRPKEVDWQAEIAARSAAPGSQLHVVGSPPERTIVRRIETTLWRVIRPLVAITGLAVTLIGKHHRAGVVLIVVWLCLMPFEWVAARRRKREKEKEEKKLEQPVEEQVQYELKNISYELRWFLAGRLSDRVTYERWLNGATQQLKEISPGVAGRWAQPDRGFGSGGATVSNVELESRRTRLLKLYAEVAPPEKVGFLTADLPQAPNARAITSS